MVNIYPETPGSEMLVWNASSFSSCAYVGGKLTARYREAELSCYGQEAAQVYNAWLEKDKVFPKDKGGRTFRNLVITITLLFIGVVALIYFFVLPWVADKASRLIPADVEVEIGDKMSAAFLQQQPTNPTADSLINEFGAAIDFETTYPVRLHVLHNPEINAFALPGGHIFVHTGILCAMTSYEQLVALLGHEVTHVKNRHSLRGFSRAAASKLMISAIFGDAGGVAGAIVSQADEFGQLDYSRELETEADLHGLEIMRANNIPEQGMLDMLELLNSEGARTPGLMKYLSTHPETQERIERVRGAIAGQESKDGSGEELRALFGALQREVQ